MNNETMQLLLDGIAHLASSQGVIIFLLVINLLLTFYLLYRNSKSIYPAAMQQKVFDDQRNGSAGTGRGLLESGEFSSSEFQDFIQNLPVEKLPEHIARALRSGHSVFYSVSYDICATKGAPVEQSRV